MHAIGWDPERAFLREQIVGDPHLVAIRVGAEGDERGVLRLPPEPSDAALARCDVDNERGTSADAVAVAIVGVFERQQSLVGNRLDQPGAEERNGHAPREDIGVVGQHRLTPVARNREHVKKRVAGGVERLELAARGPASRTQLGHRSGAADRRDVVADGAARAVEGGSEPLFARFDLEEVVQPQAELLELDRRESGQRRAQRIACLSGQCRSQKAADGESGDPAMK